MTRYVIRRVAQNVLTFFLFLTFVYFLIDAQPGDFGNVFLNDPRLTIEQRHILRARLGLDKPTYVRYITWMSKAIQGDFGTSFSNYPRPVLDVILERAPRTLVLFITAAVVSFYMGFLSGKMLAWNRSGPLEYIATIGGVGLYTVFTPWFGLMMILVFSFSLGWFPIGKFIDPILWRGSPKYVTANLVFSTMMITAIIATILLFVWLIYIRRLSSSQRAPLAWAGMGLLYVTASVGLLYATGNLVFLNIIITAIITTIWFFVWLVYIQRLNFRSQRALLAWAGVGLLLAGIVNYWLFFLGDMARYALDILWHLSLPVITLALISFAGQMLLTRSSMLETLREDYIITARAKGLPENVIRDKHAARNALLPVITSFVFSLAFALDGGVITETIFSWPGMGLTLLNAASTEDIPMAIGVLVFTGFLALTAHLVADILYAYLDPRIRYT